MAKNKPAVDATTKTTKTVWFTTLVVLGLSAVACGATGMDESETEETGEQLPIPEAGPAQMPPPPTGAPPTRISCLQITNGSQQPTCTYYYSNGTSETFNGPCPASCDG
jgi:hypothetical protein